MNNKVTPPYQVVLVPETYCIAGITIAPGLKSKSIVERNVDIDIDEAKEDKEKEEVMEEHLEKVKDVLDEKIAEVKKNNNKNLFRLLLLAAIIVGGLIQTGVIE